MNGEFRDIEGAVAMQIARRQRRRRAAGKAGGAGGSITLGGPASLSGVTFYDFDRHDPAKRPRLLVQAGNGGDGVTAGGAGGALTNVGAQNAALRRNVVLNTNELGSAHHRFRQRRQRLRWQRRRGRRRSPA